MAQTETKNMALFCDFENVALGVQEAKYAQFDIRKVLERLLLKGSIVVKKAYCDWARYKEFKAPMHEAAFELIEIPHVRQSGKNSADIRMVVDALDLCYTKSHVDTFVIISGDSDFSPLVSKLRENNKLVIGVGVKKSTSDLLMANCDEFIYYDDLVRAQREQRRGKEKRPQPKPAPPPPPRTSAQTSAATSAPNSAPTSAGEPDKPEQSLEVRQNEALELVLDTVEALFGDRDGAVHGSMIKQVLKRKRPSFSERFHGYRTFNQLLEDAGRRGLLDMHVDEKGGGFVVTAFGPKA